MTTWTKNTQLGPYALISPNWHRRDGRSVESAGHAAESHRRGQETQRGAPEAVRARSAVDRGAESSAAENQCPWVVLRVTLNRLRNVPTSRFDRKTRPERAGSASELKPSETNATI